MYNIPTFNETPVIQSQEIESAAPGLEALAQGLKGFAQGSAEVAVTAGNWRSGALMYHEMGKLAELEGQYTKDFELADTPEQVIDLMTQYRTKSTQLVDNLSVNQNDKRSFVYMAGRQLDEMARTAGYLEARMTRGANKTTLFTDLPKVLTEYQKGLLIDVENGDDLKDIETKSTLALQVAMTPFDDALRVGMITPEQHEKALDAFLTANQSAEQLYNLAAEGKADAAAYHKYTFLDGKGPGTKPANFTTQSFHFDTQESGLVDDWIAQAHEGKLGGMTYMTASPEHTIVMSETFEGIRAAKSLVGSNMPLPVIQARFNELDNEKKVLTTREKAERDQLQRQLNFLQNDYQGFLDTTTLGAQLVKQSKEDIRAINNSAATDQEKYELLKDEKNKLVSNYVSMGTAMGVDTQYIKPAQAQDVQTISNAFEGGADPNVVMDTITSYNIKNGAWLANSFDKKGDLRQYEIVQAGSLARDKKSSSIMPAMVAANQKGQDYSVVDKAFQDSNKQSPDIVIQTEAASTLTPVFDYLKTQPRGGERIQAILTDVTNYVKFQARNNNDLEIKHLDSYVKEAAQLFSDANPLVTGNGYTFNTTQINLPNGDLKAVVNFVQKQVHDYRVKTLGTDKTTYLEQNGSYTITNTPTGQIIAIDNHGNLLLPRAIDVTEELTQGARGVAAKQKTDTDTLAAKLKTNSGKQAEEILGPQVEAMVHQLEVTP